MAYNSTIRPKLDVCPMCSTERKQRLIKGLCSAHYWLQVRMKSAQKLAQREEVQEEGLPELIEEADILFSRFVRLSAADDKGMLSCFICGDPVHYKRADCMHFISRGNHFMRWDLRNCKAGCQTCNRYKDGNLVAYARRLNLDHPGIVDILLEESHLVSKPTREDVRQIIAEYSLKVKNLMRCHS